MCLTFWAYMCCILSMIEREITRTFNKVSKDVTNDSFMIFLFTDQFVIRMCDKHDSSAKLGLYDYTRAKIHAGNTSAVALSHFKHLCTWGPKTWFTKINKGYALQNASSGRDMHQVHEHSVSAIKQQCLDLEHYDLKLLHSTCFSNDFAILSFNCC